MNAAVARRGAQTAPMAKQRAYHTLTPLPDGTVIATGGGVTTEGKDTSAAVYEAEIWSPMTETWTHDGRRCSVRGSITARACCCPTGG